MEKAQVILINIGLTGIVTETEGMDGKNLGTTMATTAATRNMVAATRNTVPPEATKVPQVF